MLPPQARSLTRSLALSPLSHSLGSLLLVAHPTPHFNSAVVSPAPRESPATGFLSTSPPTHHNQPIPMPSVITTGLHSNKSYAPLADEVNPPFGNVAPSPTSVNGSIVYSKRISSPTVTLDDHGPNASSSRVLREDSDDTLSGSDHHRKGKGRGHWSSTSTEEGDESGDIGAVRSSYRLSKSKGKERAWDSDGYTRQVEPETSSYPPLNDVEEEEKRVQAVCVPWLFFFPSLFSVAAACAASSPSILEDSLKEARHTFFFLRSMVADKLCTESRQVYRARDCKAKGCKAVPSGAVASGVRVAQFLVGVVAAHLWFAYFAWVATDVVHQRVYQLGQAQQWYGMGKPHWQGQASARGHRGECPSQRRWPVSLTLAASCIADCDYGQRRPQRVHQPLRPPAATCRGREANVPYVPHDAAARSLCRSSQPLAAHDGIVTVDLTNR